MNYKKLIVPLLLVVILVLCSLLFKASRKKNLNHFPINNEKLLKCDAPLYLYLFFSKNSCTSCLGIVDELNQLSIPFHVTGVLPKHELRNEKQVRLVTGATFKLKESKGLYKFLPHYSPTLIGCSEGGIILFVLPCVPGQKDYFKNYLMQFYQKVYPTLLMDRKS